MKRIFLNFYLFVVVILLLSLFVVVPTVEHLASAPFRAQFNAYYRELVRGPLHLLAQDLDRHPPEDWPARLQQLQPRFGYPLQLVAIGDEGFSAEERALLREGDILVSRDYHQFWQRLGDSTQILSIGPFPSPGVATLLDLWTWGIFLLLLGVATLLWVTPFWRQLRQIGQTAAALGEGRFEVRAQIPPIAALAPLARTFNQMAERIQRLITSHKELTNAVSHELRTPIARLRFGLEMVESSPGKAAKAGYIDGIRRDLDELDGLVSELLTYARFDRTTLDPHLQELALAPWLEEALDEASAGIQAHLQGDIAPAQRDLRARFESRYLRRALDNLVQNAARYGNGLIRVTLERQEGEVLIPVDDDGPGIDEADRERIFEPFSRLDSSRSKDSGGYGLGLAIVRRIMESHRGAVTISPSPLGGSRFSLRWPAGAETG